MTDINALIKKLEAATEGSRELDAQIWRLVDPQASEIAFQDWRSFSGREWTNKQKDAYAQSALRLRAPHYTTSLDAALTLVPEGWGWEVGCVHGPNEIFSGKGRPWCRIWVRDNTTPILSGTHKVFGHGDSRHLNANTNALALCIAALKARNTP